MLSKCNKYKKFNRVCKAINIYTYQFLFLSSFNLENKQDLIKKNCEISHKVSQGCQKELFGHPELEYEIGIRQESIARNEKSEIEENGISIKPSVLNITGKEVAQHKIVFDETDFSLVDTNNEIRVHSNSVDVFGGLRRRNCEILSKVKQGYNENSFDLPELEGDIELNKETTDRNQKPETGGSSISNNPSSLDITEKDILQRSSVFDKTDFSLVDTKNEIRANSNCVDVFNNLGSTRLPRESWPEKLIPNIFVIEDPDPDELNANSYCEYNTKMQTLINNQEIRETFRSLTLELEGNLKISSPRQTSSVWNNGGKKRLIKQSTIEGIKTYFDTIERLERNSISCITKNRRASLPLSSTIQTRIKDLGKDINQKVRNVKNEYFFRITIKIKRYIILGNDF